MSDHSDDYWMAQALLLARTAADNNEVPVGAIVVRDNQVIGSGFNQPINLCDPTAHAEILALRDAASNTGNYRLTGASLYVTLEPCTMCAGAIIHSRIKRVIFGAKEPKAGAIISQSQQFDTTYNNHKVEYQGGVCRDECSQLISNFFSRRRREKLAAKGN